MLKQTDKITVTSHVSRDLLQSAAVFNTIPKIVWEYVSNSLDAAKEEEIAHVVVGVKSGLVTVEDNGRGMSRTELINFFQMHGENMQRRKGKRVRGRFGTGKAAAFGLANTLIIDTVQDGLRNVVKLTREDIESASDGEPIPVQDVQVDKVTYEENGTKVKVLDFNLKKRPKVEKVISHIEHHLGRYKRRSQVIINGHDCKFEEPAYIDVIEKSPPPHLREHTGDVVLTIKISPVPLDESRNGVDILSHGIWHETTLAGIENKERSQYIFGEVDVPILEDGDWPIPPFDNTRSIKLNPQNPVVAMLLGWISQELEQVRQELAQAERKRRKSERARKLAKEAEKIAEILNEDFAQQEMELEIAQRIKNRQGSKGVDEILDETGELTPGGGDIPSGKQEAGNPHGNGNRGSDRSEGETPGPGPSIINGNDPGAKKRTKKGSGKNRRPVFSIAYENVTHSEPRSRYNRNEKTIYINLDHYQIANALQASNNNIEGRQFREMCYEVASVEYALILEDEKIEKGNVLDPEDALLNVRETINRITTRFVSQLY